MMMIQVYLDDKIWTYIVSALSLLKKCSQVFVILKLRGTQLVLQIDHYSPNLLKGHVSQWSRKEQTCPHTWQSQIFSDRRNPSECQWLLEPCCHTKPPPCRIAIKCQAIACCNWDVCCNFTCCHFHVVIILVVIILVVIYILHICVSAFSMLQYTDWHCNSYNFSVAISRVANAYVAIVLMECTGCNWIDNSSGLNTIPIRIHSIWFNCAQ